MKSLTAPQRNPEDEQRLANHLAKRLREGTTMVTIAKGLGVKVKTIYDAKTRLIESGYLSEEFRNISQFKRSQKLHHPVGALTRCLDHLDPEVLRWINDQVPTGATYAEFLVSCAIDAYHDEKERKGYGK